ncbi:hypothetical protein [Sphingobacterium paramultivorum]|uniref:hypothetical protein n=1 Tax=Sphingobacterium paramultivorum TaxID=2886510 RepID=UPI001D1861A5|nr:hypothetical protein [Sphingobacterium paramultivorum]WSO16555.1 hypothetical protein VUL84_08390 [Sphingobacterium paramultivorum]
MKYSDNMGRTAAIGKIEYPKTPFKSQSQPWPGLFCEMDPRPDHGEDSHKGSGRLPSII